MREIDIWQVAKQYVDRYGGDAPIQAALQADHLLDRGDLDGAAAWQRSQSHE